MVLAISLAFAWCWKLLTVTGPISIGMTIGCASVRSSYKRQFWRWFWFCAGLLAAADWTIKHWNV
jgi:hypothetical protein